MIAVLPVLKIIGSVLLWVLAIVVALLLIVLFVPVCYRCAGVSEDPEPHEDPDLDKVKENLSGYFSFSWLFGFVRGGISYPDDPAFKVKILWFTVTGRNKPGKKKKTKNKNFRRTSSKKSTETENGADAENKSETSDTSPESEHKSLFGNIISKLQGIYDKIKKVFANTGYYVGILQSDEFKSAFAKAGKQIVRLVRAVAPRKWSVNGTVGAGDPEKTGKIMGITGMAYPLVLNHVNIRPEFMNYQMDIKAAAKGRIMIFTVVAVAMTIYFDKDIKKIIGMFKKGA